MSTSDRILLVMIAFQIVIGLFCLYERNSMKALYWLACVLANCAVLNMR